MSRPAVEVYDANVARLDNVVVIVHAAAGVRIVVASATRTGTSAGPTGRAFTAAARATTAGTTAAGALAAAAGALAAAARAAAAGTGARTTAAGPRATAQIITIMQVADVTHCVYPLISSRSFVLLKRLFS